MEDPETVERLVVPSVSKELALRLVGKRSRANVTRLAVVFSFTLTFFLDLSAQVKGPQDARPLNNEIVVQLVRGGILEDELLRVIAGAPVVAFRFLYGDMEGLSAAGVSDDAIKLMAARYYGRPVNVSLGVVPTANPTGRPESTDKSIAGAETNKLSDEARSFVSKSTARQAVPLTRNNIAADDPAEGVANLTISVWQDTITPACSKYYHEGREYRSFTWSNGRISATMWRDAGGTYASVTVDNISGNATDVLLRQFSLQDVAKGKLLTARDKQKEALSARKWSSIAAAISVAGGEIANARGTNTSATVTGNGYTSRVTLHQQGNPLALGQGYAKAAAITAGQAARERSAFENYLKNQTVLTGETISGVVAFQRSKAGDYVLRFETGQNRIEIPFQVN
jgi:hypothetical protein